MGTYILRRLFLMFPTLIGITFLIFMLIALSPGGIGASLRVSGGQMEASSRALQEAYLEDRYGLDDPAVVQYVRWLGRVSPVKFGTRALMDPDGSRLLPPKPVKDPIAWRWFTDALPTPPPAAPASFAPDAAAEQNARAYRAAFNTYMRARGSYIADRARLDTALGTYLRVVGSDSAVTPRGRTIENRLPASPPHLDQDPPAEPPAEWQAVQTAADAMLSSYEAVNREQLALTAVFAARPFPEAGVGLGPIWLDWPDFGKSFSKSRPVLDLIAEALPITLLLNLVAFPIIYFIAVPCGLLAAVRRGGLFDSISGIGFIALWSFPIPLAGVLAVGYLANNEYLGWFPVAGLHSSGSEGFTYLPTTGADGAWHPGYLLDMLWHVCLPVLCLVYGGFAVLSKQTRAAMLDNFNADYVRTAKAKGVAAKDVVLAHVFRNSLLPLITLAVTIFPAMLSGSVIIEQIFSVRGMGWLTIEAITLRDRELILANALMIGLVNVFSLLLADILYAFADPRISYS